jgi:hypothetical protein
MLHTIFDHDIYIKEFEDLGKFESYRKVFVNQLLNVIHSFYADNSVLMKKKEPLEIKGDLVSSLGTGDNKPIQHLMGYSLLDKILNPSITEAIKLMYKDNKFTKIELVRTWHNVNYKHSSVISHNHTLAVKAVLICILYLDAPKNSGKLAIINSDVKGLNCLDYDQDKVYYITVKPNMLVCHKGDVLHAVSEHLSDDRRTCILFEYTLE